MNKHNKHNWQNWAALFTALVSALAITIFLYGGVRAYVKNEETIYDNFQMVSRALAGLIILQQDVIRLDKSVAILQKCGVNHEQ